MARSLRLEGAVKKDCPAMWGEGDFGKVGALALLSTSYFPCRNKSYHLY